MNQVTQARSGDACDHRLVDQFLDSENYRIEDEALITHLDSCLTCRNYLEKEAGSPEVWRNATELLKPNEFDQAATAVYSVSTLSGDVLRQPVAARDVLDLLTPSEDPQHLGRLGTYEVTGVVGVGGMGVVLKAIDPSLDRVVAVKVMAPRLANNENARKRFAREAKAAAAVLHPNVVPIHSVSSDSSLPYLVMAYIRGGPLQNRLESEGPLKLVEVLRIGSQIAAGLAAAHEQGLIHRDIKPENILLEEGVERVTITDFGLARAVDDNTVTQQGAIAGTPQYMSPEQADGKPLDQQSDLFSLGSVLYALCTGQPPYRGETSYAVMRKIIDESPMPIRELNPDIPQWLEGIVAKLMSKEKMQRFASASEVHKLMDACLSHVQQPETISLPAEAAVLNRVFSEGEVPRRLQKLRGLTDRSPRGFKRKSQAAVSLSWFLLLLLTLGSGIFTYAFRWDYRIVGVLGGLCTFGYLVFKVPRRAIGQHGPAQTFVSRHRAAFILGALVCIAGATLDMLFLPPWLGVLQTVSEKSELDQLLEVDDFRATEFSVRQANVDLAERLVGRTEHLTFTKLEKLTPEVAMILARHPANLSFPALEQISPEVANALGRKKHLWLSLDGIQKISRDVARELASTRCGLVLGNLQAVTPELATILAQKKGSLRLGLASITPEVASALSQHEGWLSLNDLHSIDLVSAAALAAHQHWISLNGLKTLTPDLAEALANFNGETLDLNGLKSLDLEVAKKLAVARCRNGLYLNGLVTVTPAILEVLANGNFGISLQGLEKIDMETKQALDAVGEKLQENRQSFLVRDLRHVQVVETNDQRVSEPEIDTSQSLK